MNSAPWFTRTRIVATVGPSSNSADTLEHLLHAGVDVFRLNLSHGDWDTHAQTIARIRDVESRLETPAGIMADLPGPKLRLAADTQLVELEDASEVLFRVNGTAAEDELEVDVPHVLSGVEPGHRILLDDGALSLVVHEHTDDCIRCKVLKGGPVRPRIGVNLPDGKSALPAVGEHDLDLAKRALKAGVDFIAVSFCETGDDLRSLRSELGAHSADVHLVAKIERPLAVKNLDDIISASDVILIARGDLGVEMDVAEVPIIQKRIINASRQEGCPVIVATQMLQSMIESPVPTRAEASDVANAICDGADAVMLSGETAIGHHPLLAVETMDRIARATESYCDHGNAHSSDSPKETTRSRWMPALSRGVWRMVEDMPVSAIAMWTASGESARTLAREDIHAPILAFCDDITVARRMQILRGVQSIVVPTPKDQEEFREHVDTQLAKHPHAQANDTCIVLAPSSFLADSDLDVLELRPMIGNLE